MSQKIKSIIKIIIYLVFGFALGRSVISNFFSDILLLIKTLHPEAPGRLFADFLFLILLIFIIKEIIKEIKNLQKK